MANTVNLLNKIITNRPVDLTPEEINVLQYTLGQVLSAENTDFRYWRPTLVNGEQLTWELNKSILPPGNMYVRGSDGDNGRTPVFSANPEDAHLLWMYEDSTSGWTDTGFSISGDIGPEGQRGEAGRTPTFRICETDKMFQWEYVGEGEQGWKNLDLITSGNNGKDGVDGFSPSFSAEEIPVTTDRRGGYKVTVQFGPEGSETSSFNLYNGLDGTGADFKVIEGTGLSVSQNGSQFTVGLDSTTQNTLSEVGVLKAASADWNDVSAKLDKTTWDTASAQFVTSAGLAADTWYLMTTSGWKPSDSVLTAIEHDDTLSGNGWNSSPLGLAQNVREETFSAGYADMASSAQYTWYTDNGKTTRYALGDWIQWLANNQSDILTEKVRHDSTLKGDGTTTSDLGIADNVNIQSFSAGYATKANSAASANVAANYVWYDESTVPPLRNESSLDDLHHNVYDISDEVDTLSEEVYSELYPMVRAKLDTSAANYLPLSGGNLSGALSVSATEKQIWARGTNAFQIGSTRYNDNGNAIGSTWVGVNGTGSKGFIKFADNSEGGDSQRSLQINFGAASNGYGEILLANNYNDVATNSRIINVPEQSYTNMSAFDPTNGPNYMLRKTASGFDIGAKVVNVRGSLPGTTEANTYYFIYDA